MQECLHGVGETRFGAIGHKGQDTAACVFEDDAALSFSTEDLSMNASNYLPIEDMETAYLHGNEDWRMFDCYGPVFTGFPNEGNVGLMVFTCITMAMVSVALSLLVSGLALRRSKSSSSFCCLSFRKFCCVARTSPP